MRIDPIRSPKTVFFTREQRGPGITSDRAAGATHFTCAVGAMMRFRVAPRDVSREAAARRIGLTPAQFDTRYDNLVARGFPASDPDTGNFDLLAIDRWCDARHPHLFGGENIMQARDASNVVRDRISKMKVGASR